MAINKNGNEDAPSPLASPAAAAMMMCVNVISARLLPRELLPIPPRAE